MAGTANWGQLVGGIASAAPAVISSIQGIGQANDLIDNIGKKGIDPESQYLKDANAMALKNANKGFTEGETAAFKQAVADASNAAYKKALINSGGNQSQAILAAIKGPQFAALNEFARNDNAIMRNNRQAVYGLAGSLAGNELAQKQLNNQKQMQAGMGLAAQRYNLTNAATTFGNTIKSWFGNPATPETPQAKVAEPIAAEQPYQPDVNSFAYNKGLGGINGYDTGFSSSGYVPQEYDFPTYNQSGPTAE